MKAQQTTLFEIPRELDLTVDRGNPFSFGSIKRAIAIAPTRATEKQICNSLVRLSWYLDCHYYYHAHLPREFFDATCYGPTPKDPWMIVNARYVSDQCLEELSKRNIEVTIWLEGVYTYEPCN